MRFRSHKLINALHQKLRFDQSATLFIALISAHSPFQESAKRLRMFTYGIFSEYVLFVDVARRGLKKVNLGLTRRSRILIIYSREMLVICEYYRHMTPNEICRVWNRL